MQHKPQPAGNAKFYLSKYGCNPRTQKCDDYKTYSLDILTRGLAGRASHKRVQYKKGKCKACNKGRHPTGPYRMMMCARPGDRITVNVPSVRGKFGPRVKTTKWRRKWTKLMGNWRRGPKYQKLSFPKGEEPESLDKYYDTNAKKWVTGGAYVGAAWDWSRRRKRHTCAIKAPVGCWSKEPKGCAAPGCVTLKRKSQKDACGRYLDPTSFRSDGTAYYAYMPITGKLDQAPDRKLCELELRYSFARCPRCLPLGLIQGQSGGPGQCRDKPKRMGRRCAQDCACKKGYAVADVRTYAVGPHKDLPECEQWFVQAAAVVQILHTTTRGPYVDEQVAQCQMHKMIHSCLKNAVRVRNRCIKDSKVKKAADLKNVQRTKQACRNDFTNTKKACQKKKKQSLEILEEFKRYARKAHRAWSCPNFKRKKCPREEKLPGKCPATFCGDPDLYTRKQHTSLRHLCFEVADRPGADASWSKIKSDSSHLQCSCDPKRQTCHRACSTASAYFCKGTGRRGGISNAMGNDEEDA